MNSCLRIHPYHLAGEDCWIQMCDNQCVLMRFSKLLCVFNLDTFCVNDWRLNPVAVMLMTELLHWSLVSFFFFSPPWSGCGAFMTFRVTVCCQRSRETFTIQYVSESADGAALQWDPMTISLGCCWRELSSSTSSTSLPVSQWISFSSYFRSIFVQQKNEH